MPLPSYPVLPSPRTWSPDDFLLTRYWRADVTNAVKLMTGPPLVVAAQTVAGQGVPQNAVTPLDLDTEYTDTWASHQIPSPQVTGPLPGWYLCEGYHTLSQADGTSVTTAGLRLVQDGSQEDVYGAQTSCPGVSLYQPSPGVADLVLLNGVTTAYPFTATSAGSVFTAPGSSYADGTPVTLASAGGTLPSGFAEAVTYWVVSATGDTFQLSGAEGGAPATVTSTGTGTVQATDTVALTALQTSATTPVVQSAYLTAMWAGAPSGNLVSNPVPPAPWPPGDGVVLLAAIAEGATVLPVSTAQGMVAGGTLGLDAAPPVAEQVTITAVSGTTISVTPAAYPHEAGCPVAVPISAAWLDQQVRDQIRLMACPPMARLSNNSGPGQVIPSQAFPAGTPVDWWHSASRTGTGAWLDNYSGWSTAAGITKYTFPLPGVWYLYGQVSINGTPTTGPWSLAAGLRYNGGQANWGDVIPAVPGAAAITATVRRHNRVNAGDYVEVMASQGYGVGLSVNSGTAQCRFLAIWRGW